LKSVKNGKKKNVDNGTVSTNDFFNREKKKCKNVEFVTLPKNYTCETIKRPMLEIKTLSNLQIYCFVK